MISLVCCSLDMGTIFLFLMEMMVEHVSKRIKFGLLLLFIGASFEVWDMVSLICNDWNLTQASYTDDGKFPE